LIGFSRKVGVRHARCKDEAKAVARTCRIGETTIINTIHPMKLALGSNKIKGIPKLARSADGSSNMRAGGAQIIIIINNVKQDVRIDASMHFFSNSRKLAASRMNIRGANQPTTNPRRIAKKGTPMPAPIARRSRKQNAMIGSRNRREINLDIILFL
jgi:hypothetical protein